MDEGLTPHDLRFSGKPPCSQCCRDRGAALANGKAKIDDIRATDFVARSVQPL